jgi:hypothetical protein
VRKAGSGGPHAAIQRVRANRESQSFEAFRSDLLARHQNILTNRLSTVGDAVMLAGLGLMFVSDKRAAAPATFGIGVAIAGIAHLFQPGTLGTEVAAIGRHPVWTLRAETDRVFGSGNGRP